MCKFCDFQKWDYHNFDSNAYIIAEGEYGAIYMGCANVYDADNKLIKIFSYDDDSEFGFYPSYCPFCGRKLKD